MTIKVGDIVKYNGVEARLMRISDDNNQAANRLELVESIPNTTLKDGDEVVIRDISDDEKKEYGAHWVSGMDELALSSSTFIVENIQYSDYIGWIGRIGNYMFQLYHIEPVTNFDIV